MSFTTIEDAASYFFANPDLCHHLFLTARWPSAIWCPHCNGHYKPRKNVEQMHCRECYRYFSVRTGTILSGSRLPLSHWTTVAWSAVQTRRVSARRIAWSLKQRNHHATCRVTRIVNDVAQKMNWNDNWWDLNSTEKFHQILRELSIGHRTRVVA
jgi:hypothetical protein